MATTWRSADDVPSNIPPGPAGSRGAWADAYRHGFQDGQQGKAKSPPKDPGLASAYLQGYANGQTVQQQAEARARSWAHALGLDEASKAYRRQQELAGPPKIPSGVRRGRSPGAR